MRFMTTLAEEKRHTDLVGCVGWSNTEEVYSCGDDHVLLKWQLASNENETVKVADLPADLYPTDMHWYPRAQVNKKNLELLLITSADGKFHLLNKSGRFEKSVDAHKGAILSGHWSYDGQGFLTAGEDGQVKIWSRNGMLRSTILQSNVPVYSATWGPDSNHVLHTMGKMLVLKSLAPNSNPNRWKAHEGLILKVSWNPNNNLIVSGGEDCRYKVWDTYGRQLYMSSAHDFPITSVNWSPSGDMFAVGSYNTLRLCDKAGWSHSLDKPTTGSIFNIAWSSDGTQVAGACGNGHVIFAHIIERRLEWHKYEATVTARKSIAVRNVTNEEKEELEFRDHVIKVTLGFGYLVVATPLQCYIYNANNWNTPIIFNLREGSVLMILMAQRHFLIVEKTSVSLYNYEGRLVGSPRWPVMQPDSLNKSCISISSDTIAVRDQVDEKLVRLFEVGSNRNLGELPPISHSQALIEVALNQGGNMSERQIAVIDRVRDLYLCIVKDATTSKMRKLGPIIHSLCWNSSTNLLAAVQDSSIMVWYYPTCIYASRHILKKTIYQKDASEFGKSPTIVSFIESTILLRRLDGTLINIAVSTFPAILHGYVASEKWDSALRLCRFVKDYTLWSCLASMATYAKNVSAAVEAYAQIGENDKVHYLLKIKKASVQAIQMAEMALLGGNIQEGESIFLQNGYIFRAIITNVQVHNWTRALELATKHKTHVDTVLFYRQKYLETAEKPEIYESFLQLQNEVELDPEKIAAKEALEYEKENANEVSEKEKEEANQVFEKEKANQVFEKEKANQVFENEKANQVFEKEKANQVFEKEKANQVFEKEKANQVFEKEKANQVFENEKANQVFEKENQMVEKDKENQVVEKESV